MKKLDLQSIKSNEQYAQQRPVIRKSIMEHKKNRRVQVGPNVSLYFEDYMTMKYQIQELMRVEKITTEEAIQEEIAAYNPLIPDGKNLKATMMIEYPNEEERKVALGKLIGIENKISIRIGDAELSYPIADEDLERETEEKTSAVHFLRYEFSEQAIIAAKAGASWSIHCNHENYQHSVDSLQENISNSLAKDFD